MENSQLRKAGLKVTHPRVKILNILETSDKRHWSAEDVFKELLAADEEVGIATVYRVLTQFESAGIVTRHNFSDGHSVFELDHGEHHDHMVDLESGDVIEFVNDDIEKLQHTIAEAHGYEIIDHSLVLYVKKKSS